MKKNLRLLCLGLAAATVTCGFAQEDKTSLLKNADMEQGLKGWSFDGVDVMGKNTKVATTKIGFHGMTQGVQEAWHSSYSNPLGDSYVMQRLGNLPSGTYVFGAYAAAAKQHNRNDVCEREIKNDKETHILIDGKHQYGEYWSNRDSIQGVVLFANDATVRVATDNPDLSERSQLWGHSSKFNVAVTLTDQDERKGWLDVGMRVTETNANYIVWDNATLYYFGNMSEAAALDAMAEIDMTKAAEIADTLTSGFVMQADTLANLKAAIAAIKAGTTTAATLWDDSEKLHSAAGLARRSITDYNNLKKNIESALVVLDGEWTEFAVENDIPLLEEQIAVAQAAYEAAELGRGDLTDLRTQLNWAAGAVKLDSVFEIQTYLDDYIYAAYEKINQPGGCSQSQVAGLEALATELGDTLDTYQAELDEELAFEDRKCNPNNIYPYLAKVIAAIENVENNPYTSDYTQMPIHLAYSEEASGVEGTTVNSAGLKEYVSPTYLFESPIERFTITVLKAAGGSAFFTLSELSFFDANGNEIELTEDNVSSKYDHNKINGEGADGQGVPGLLDDDAETYFHSAWSNSPAGYHSLDIVLPNGGYTAFYFKMVARKGQPHQFPGEIEISTPMPNRADLQALIAEAKAKNAYSSNEIGFYTVDFSYLTDKVAEIEAALENGNPSEAECEEMRLALQRQLNAFNKEEDKSVHLPVAGKAYHVISAVPDFFKKQLVEKALTIHTDTITSLWWSTASVDSLQQQFVFNPIMEDEEHVVKMDGETALYAYTMQNKSTGLYVDSAFVNNGLRLVGEAHDTVFLKSLGRGQWNIMVKGNQMHMGDHNSGAAGNTKGAYGGTWGISSAIVSWATGLDGASAWFISEMPVLPLTVLVEGAEFESQYVRFATANTVTLTADKACAFNNLVIRDLLGNAIEAEVVVDGAKATISLASEISGCSFAFTNSEGVASVAFNAYIPTIQRLQEAYDVAVAVAPEQGDGVMQYADITAYTTAIEKAEAMIDLGTVSDKEIDTMIAELEAAVAGLKPNMPVAGKHYYIFSGLDKFENNHGYKMALYASYEAKLCWAQENECEWNRIWQFEQATESELADLKVKDTTIPAFYIKNVGTGKYIGNVANMSTQLDMVSTKSSTVPYTFTSLEGAIVAIAGANDASHRLHCAGHGEGKSKSGSVVYWNSGMGTASIWTISEAQYDATDLDFTEIEPETAVVKGTYDLFGRRVVAPTAPGIYIIDGKKKYIKK